MIAHLRGTLMERGAEAIVLDVGGVGYAVNITTGAYKALPALGTEARLHIYTHATQDGPLQLFGFVDIVERRLFETLLSVQGVGPKVAVAMLSGVSIGDLVRAIAGSDLSRLTQIRGVGRKTAERLCVELRDKIAAVASGSDRTVPSVALPSIVPAGRLGEVHGALVALGYKPAEFESVLPTLDAALPAADLVKQALAALRKK